MPSPSADLGELPTDVLRAELDGWFTTLRSGICDDIDWVTRAAIREELERLNGAKAQQVDSHSESGSSPEASGHRRRRLAPQEGSTKIAVDRSDTNSSGTGIFKHGQSREIEAERLLDEVVTEALDEGQRALETQISAELISREVSPAHSSMKTAARAAAVTFEERPHHSMVRSAAEATESLQLLSSAAEEEFGLLSRHRRGYLAGRELYPDEMRTSDSDQKRKTMNMRRSSSCLHNRTVEFPSVSTEATSGVRALCLQPSAAVLQARLSLEWFVCTYYFDAFSAATVFGNAIAIGMQADAEALGRRVEDLSAYEVIDRIFCGVFTIELLLRLWAYGLREFFRGQMSVWNCFDLALLMVQYVELVVAEVLILAHADVGETLNALSFWRVIRLLRILRIVRLLRGITELRTIVVSIFGTLRTLAWTMVLLALVIYICAIGMLEMVSSVVDSLSEGEREVLQRYWGSLAQAMLVLFQTISNGVDWDNVLNPLMEFISPWVAIPFCFYIGFGIFALMNIVTGVFVESAVESAKKEHERFLLHTVQKLFNTTDDDKSGEITWQEFQNKLDHPDMRTYFKSIDLDLDEAQDLFKLIDIDDSGTIDPEEFVNGCIRLQGPAKAIDLATLMHEYRRRERREFVRHNSVARAIVLLLRSHLVATGVAAKEEIFETPDEEHLKPFAFAAPCTKVA